MNNEIKDNNGNCEWNYTRIYCTKHWLWTMWHHLHQENMCRRFINTRGRESTPSSSGETLKNTIVIKLYEKNLKETSLRRKLNTITTIISVNKKKLETNK